jgi:hypothetical protein
MTRLISYIIRFFLITIAFLSAAIGASAFMIFLIWGALSRGEIGNSEFQNFVHLAAGISTPLLAAFVAYYTFLPAMLVALISEYLAKRSWLFHALGGIAVALVAISRRADANSFATPPSSIMLIIVASGVIFGTIYWLIAGRSAGQISGRIV